MTTLVRRFQCLPFAYHVRSQRKATALDAIGEVFSFHEGTNSHCHISHLKFGGCSGDEAEALFERFMCIVQKRSFQITWDAYPFGTSATALRSLLTRNTAATEDDRHDADLLVQRDDRWLSLSEIRSAEGCCLQTVVERIVAENPHAVALRRSMDDGDAMMICRHKRTLIGSDSFGSSFIHPRQQDTFPRLLRSSRSEADLVQWADRFCTLPARTFAGLETYSIEDGNLANLVLVNLQPSSLDDGFSGTGHSDLMFFDGTLQP